MNNWDTKVYQWYFPKLDGGDQKGFNDAGINTFRDKPFKNLAREIIQNSLDAKGKKILHPVIVKFSEETIKPEMFPQSDFFLQVVDHCKKFYCTGDDGNKLKAFRDEVYNTLFSGEDIKILKISDYNTTGLTGSDRESNTNWINLVKSSGASNKQGGSGGSYGIGKHAPFNFSSLRTVFYSTYDNEGLSAIQGKAILTTHKDDEGNMHQNIGYFGLANGCKPILNIEKVPDFFKRYEAGADLFILGFKNNEDWKNQVVSAVLDHFFYAIYKEELVVEVDDGHGRTIINNDTMFGLVEEYEQINIEKEEEFSARKYIQVLESTEKKVFTDNFKGMGKIELYLLPKKEFAARKIALIRKTGMKITDKKGFRVPLNFYGIFLATGDGQTDYSVENINDFLRRCEPSSHDNWSGDLYEGDTRRANKILKDLNKWITDRVKEITPASSENEVDASGMSQFLPDEYDESTDESEEKAFMQFIPIPTTVVPEKDKRVMARVDSVYQFKEEYFNYGNEGIEVDFKSADRGRKKGSSNINWRRSKEKNRVTKKDQDRQGKKAVSIIPLVKNKTPYNEVDHSYHVIIIPKIGAPNGYIRLRIGGDDDEMKDADIKSATIDGVDMKVRDGYIFGINFKAGKEMKFVVLLNNLERCLLEVGAYA